MKDSKQKWEMRWRKIADILYHGFLDVHHGKSAPIDVIELVQAEYNQTLNQQRKKLVSELEVEKVKPPKEMEFFIEMEKEMTNAYLEAGKVIGYNQGLQTAIDKLQEKK